MNKLHNISYFISKSIFIAGICLIIMLVIRYLIGFEVTTEPYNEKYLIEEPILDVSIILTGLFTLYLSFFYYPLLFLTMVFWLIFRNKLTKNKIELSVSIKRHFFLCLLTFLIGFIVFLMAIPLIDNFR